MSSLGEPGMQRTLGFLSSDHVAHLSSLKHSSRCSAHVHIAKVHLRNNSHLEVSRGNQPKTHPLMICLKNCVIQSVSGCLFLTSMENSWEIKVSQFNSWEECGTPSFIITCVGWGSFIQSSSGNVKAVQLPRLRA